MTFFVIDDLPYRGETRAEGPDLRTRPGMTLCLGTAYVTFPRIDDVTFIDDIARCSVSQSDSLVKQPDADMRHHPVQTERILAPLQIVLDTLTRGRERSEQSFCLLSCQAGSNDRKHERDHKKYRRPEQQIIAID
jgi:hypothetical protein